MDLLYFRQQHSLASGHGTHTPFLEQWGLFQQRGEMLFAAMVGGKASLLVLSSIPRQLENSSYQVLWSSGQIVWRSSLPRIHLTALFGGIHSP